MNSSKTNEILKDIKTNTANITTNETGAGNTSSDTLRVISATDDTNWSTSNTNTTNMASTLVNHYAELAEANGHHSTSKTYLSTILTNTTSSHVTLGDIETELNTINSKLVDIGVTLAKDENKIWFSAQLDYDGTNYIPYTDYSSSAITGYYSNSSGNKQYITQFNFAYEESTEPDVSGDLYHSPKFDTKIGKMNSSNTFEVPYATIPDNRAQSTNVSKLDMYSPIAWDWTYDYTNYPIVLDTDERFGHYINGDFTSTYYDSWCVGTVKGYYYS